ncbi:hypothetical protein BT69DRAFT_1118384 [Atractiella rhizophila]|nr:hypothetical protein BT69DRAFT_1118384 [Atractiella rhizophila]
MALVARDNVEEKDTHPISLKAPQPHLERGNSLIQQSYSLKSPSFFFPESEVNSRIIERRFAASGLASWENRGPLWFSVEPGWDDAEVIWGDERSGAINKAGCQKSNLATYRARWRWLNVARGAPFFLLEVLQTFCSRGRKLTELHARYYDRIRRRCSKTT